MFHTVVGVLEGTCLVNPFTPKGKYTVGAQEIYIRQLSKQMDGAVCLYQIMIKMQIS